MFYNALYKVLLTISLVNVSFAAPAGVRMTDTVTRPDSELLVDINTLMQEIRQARATGQTVDPIHIKHLKNDIVAIDMPAMARQNARDPRLIPATTVDDVSDEELSVYEASLNSLDRDGIDNLIDYYHDLQIENTEDPQQVDPYDELKGLVHHLKKVSPELFKQLLIEFPEIAYDRAQDDFIDMKSKKEVSGLLRLAVNAQNYEVAHMVIERSPPGSFDNFLKNDELDGLLKKGDYNMFHLFYKGKAADYLRAHDLKKFKHLSDEALLKMKLDDKSNVENIKYDHKMAAVMVESDDYEGLKRLLRDDKPSNYLLYDYENTKHAFQLCVKANHQDMIMRMLNDPELQHRFHYSDFERQFSYVAAHGSLEFFKFMLGYVANPEVHHNQAFREAVENGNVEVVDYMLKEVAKINPSSMNNEAYLKNLSKMKHLEEAIKHHKKDQQWALQEELKARKTIHELLYSHSEVVRVMKQQARIFGRIRPLPDYLAKESIRRQNRKLIHFGILKAMAKYSLRQNYINKYGLDAYNQNLAAAKQKRAARR